MAQYGAREGFVAARPMGVNGIPEVVQGEDVLKEDAIRFGDCGEETVAAEWTVPASSSAVSASPAGTSSVQRARPYLEWLAVSAVAVGTVGAVIGYARARARRAASSDCDAVVVFDFEGTKPHGDKLLGTDRDRW